MSAIEYNISGKIVNYFVSSKLTILVIMACFLLGFIALTQTPREENPQIIVPGANIYVSLPGASAKEVEQLLLNPLEAIVGEMTQVDHIYGVAMNSMAVVSVQFEVGEDKERSLVKIYDRILGQQDRLPKDALDPVIKSIDVDDVPIVTVTLASENYNDYALKRLADRMLEGIRSLETASVSYIKGGRNREIRVELNPERLQAFGISIDHAQAMIRASNVATAIGTFTQQGENKDLFVNSFIQTVDDVRQTVIGNHKGQLIYIDDVANVMDGPATERKQLSRFAFGPADPRFNLAHSPEMPAVTLAVAKKQGSNSVVVANDILARVKRMQKDFIPHDVQVIVTRNDGQKADDSVNDLMGNLGMAIIVVFIITLLSLGTKEALIVGISIPLILALTLGADYLFGLTINRLTLFSLILSLGMLVDAPIVVIENMHRHYQNIKPENKKLASVLAVNEIGSPTNLATFSIMLVFVSMLMLTGMPAPYFFPIIFNVPVTMFASLLVAYIVTPWMAQKWLKAGEGKDLDTFDKKDKLHIFYRSIIEPFVDKPKARSLLFIGVIVMLVAALLQPAWQFIRPQGVSGPTSLLGVEMGMLPKDNKNTINITLDMSESTPVEVTDEVVRKIGRVLANETEIINYQTWIGTAGVIDFNGLLRGAGDKKASYVAEVRVNLTHKNDRNITSVDIVRQLRPKIQKIQSSYPGSVIKIVEDPPGPPVRATVLAEIYGADASELRKLSGKVVNEFKQTYDLVEIQDSEVEEVREYQVNIKKQKAAYSGINAVEITAALQLLASDVVVSHAHIAGEKNPVPIRVYVPYSDQIDPQRLSRIYVSSPQGERLPLSEFIDIIPAWKDHPIQHKDKVQVTYIGAEMAKSSPLYAVVDLDQRLDGLKLDNNQQLTTGNLSFTEQMPDITKGYQLLWNGEMRMTLDIYRDLSNALALSFTAMFLLLVAYYRSFIIPMIAMAAIPLGLIGIFPGHWIMGQMTSAPSIIGLIALAGVVVRNSLLIIDFVHDFMEEGMALREAICEAGAVRLRSILLTAISTVLGTSFMLPDPVFGGLAISLIFGTIAATLLTLLVIPVLLYMFLEGKMERRKLRR